MARLEKMDLQEKLVKQDLPDLLGLRAEGEQELQVYLELMVYQVDLDLKEQQVPRVFRDFPAHLAQMVFLVCQAHFKISMETFSVQQSALQVHRVHLECQGSRATLDTKEIKERLGRMERREMLVLLVSLVCQVLWVCRAREVLEGCRGPWDQ